MNYLRALVVLGVVILFAAQSEAQTLTIYDDALQNSFSGGYSYGATLPDFDSTAQPRTGAKSISFVGDSFNAIGIGRVTDVSTATYPVLRFWVHGGATGGQQLRLILQRDNVPLADAELDGFIGGGAIVAGAWREVTVNLAQAPFNAASFDRIDLQSDIAGGQPVLYIDDITLGQVAAQVVPPMQIERDVMVGPVTPMESDRFTWQDSTNRPRVAVLAHNDGQFGPQAPGGYPNRGGALREFRYQMPDNTNRIADVTTYGNGGYGGFGYPVSHRQEVGAGGIGDDSPLGMAFPGSFVRVFEGRHHAIFRFTLLYPRYSTTVANPPNTRYDVPVTIEWMFSTGRDHPLWAITWDLFAVPANALNDDSRAPYGELNIDGAGAANVDGVAWGDRYKFVSETAPLTLNSHWNWVPVNMVPYVKLWIAATNATMGIVQTQTMGQQDAGGGRIPGYYDNADYWGKTSANGNAGPTYRMPFQYEWPYQALSFSLAAPDGNTNNARLTWGTQYGFLGQENYDVNDRIVATATGHPRKSYSTYIVLGPHSTDPVGAQVTQVETVQSLTFTPTIGTVVTSGPAGVTRPENMTYAPAGYNHVYGALAFNATGNQLDMNIIVGAGTLKKPLIIVGNYTAGDPQLVKFANVTLTADADYFASVRAAASELWITLNRDLAGAVNRLEITGGGLGTPTNFVAAATSASQVAISWTVVAGAVEYEIHRSSLNSAYTLLTTIVAPGTTHNDIGLTADRTYLYKVRALGPGGPSGFSPVDPATTILFTDDPLNAGTLTKAIHVTQLRTAVNAMRAAAPGLAAQAFTDPGLAAGISIKRVHVTELRTALDAARAAIGLTALVYVDPVITAGATTVKTAHVTNLRNGVK